MMRTTILIFGLATPLLVPGAAAQQDRSLLGAEVRVLFAGRHAGLSGELIAISADSVWVLGDAGLMRGAALTEVPRVAVRRHGLSSGAILGWGAVGGLVTGGLLTAACSSVADDCGGVFAFTALTWAVATAVSAVTVEASRWKDFRAPSYPGLSAYARFPQGLPPGLDTELLATKADSTNR